ncbi:MAG: glutamate--tRNA ligase [Oscillospiraceae bacterium]|nr:glutamate--tRNA ligase [Oscillospiraceae bacterium]
MNNDDLASLLFPHVHLTLEELEEKYPPRDLPEGAKATRFPPSPTGFMHLGNLFTAFVDILAARSSGGLCFLRIEDTDKKREVEDGVSAIINGFAAFGLSFQEGVTGFGTEKGLYAPYTQSERAEVYQAMAKRLVQNGQAYPCFCSEEELSAMRDEQERAGAQVKGYFGPWAKCRELTYEEIEQKVNAGQSWVLRLRSGGDENKRIVLDDLIKGKIEMPENTMDVVLLKADGIPTYHFAHACDDHFMRVTTVIRGDEWLASVSVHIALFKACGFKLPKYAHVAPVMKEDAGGKRKLSKRKDPEAAVSYFAKEGYPAESVLDYLMTLINSNFEDWRRANPRADRFEFPFSFKKMSQSGALFDLVKLCDVSKNVISLMTADEVYSGASEWAREYDPELYNILTADPGFAKAVFSIERGGDKPRKDIAKWSEVRDYAAYLYDALYTPNIALPENINPDGAAAILKAYLDAYDASDDKDTWFQKIKDLCGPLGYTPNVKEYKQSPEKFKGHIGDVSSVIRIAATSRRNTPDLHAIMALLGKDRVRERINAALSCLTANN